MTDAVVKGTYSDFKLITDNENFGREKCQELWKESPYYEES